MTSTTKLFRFLFVFLVAWGTVVFAADPAADDYNLGVNLFKQSRWKPATEVFRKFISDYPQHERTPTAQLYLALSLVNQQQYDEARTILRGLAKGNPQSANIAQIRFRLAECSFLMDDFPAARIELKEFLATHGDDPLAARALPYLGDVELQLKDPAALATFQQAIQKYPQGPLIADAELGLARATAAAGNGAEANRLFEAIAGSEKHPHAVQAEFMLASTAFDEHRYDEAAKRYQHLATAFPNHVLAATARMNAGYALYQGHQYKDANEQFAKVATVPANRLQALYWQALSLKHLGNIEDSLAKFREAYQEAGDKPFAETVLYQQAAAERQSGRGNDAIRHCRELVKRWPQGDLADDSLQMAAEIALDSGDLEAANDLLKLFDEKYPTSGLKMSMAILQGRLLLARGAAAATPETAKAPWDAAATRFELVAKESKITRTQLQAQYYLALTRQLQGKSVEALETVAPVIQAIAQEGATTDLGDAWVLQGDAALATERFPLAANAAQTYLKTFPKGGLRPRSYAIDAIAEARQKHWTEATAALEAFQAEFPNHNTLPNTVLTVAEAAEAHAAWPEAERYYRQLEPLATGSENEAFAHRGIGWALYRQGRFQDAAAAFLKVSVAQPKHPLAAEADYYAAESLLLAKQPTEALTRFRETFAKYQPQQPATPKQEQRSPWIFSYRSGVQIARLLKEEGKIDDADKAYDAVNAKFPKPERLDQLLDEWALLNYEAGRYERADTLFRRIVLETPESDLADNAQLSLAESELVGGHPEQARSAFQALINSPTAESAVKERAYYQLTVLETDQRRWKDVAALADQFSASYPASPQRTYLQLLGLEAQLALDPPGEALKGLEGKIETLKSEITAARERGDQHDWDGRVWVLAAEVAYRLKDYEAIDSIASALKAWVPPSPIAWQIDEVRGRGFKQQAKFDEARAAFQDLLKAPEAFRTETAAKTQLLIAETYFLQEDWQKAFLEYQKVYASYDFPDWQSAALLQAGKCDEQQGQFTEAAATYERLIREFTTTPSAVDAKARLETIRQRKTS